MDDLVFCRVPEKEILSALLVKIVYALAVIKFAEANSWIGKQLSIAHSIAWPLLIHCVDRVLVGCYLRTKFHIGAVSSVLDLGGLREVVIE